MSHTAADRPGAEAETWVRSAFDLLCEVPSVHRAGVALVEGGGRRLSFTASDRDHASHTDWCEVDAYDDVPLNNTIRTGRLILGSLAELAGRYPEFVGRQVSSTQALASVPLSAAGQVMGGFVLFYASGQPFDDPQRAQLRDVGERLGEDLRHGQRARALPDRSFAGDPVPDGARMSTHVVAPEPHGVAMARQFVRQTLAEWAIHGDSVDVAVLCVSELVTNAVIHTVAGCEVRLLLQGGVLTISVRDAGRDARPPRGTAADPLAVHGRGLQLVAALSARWGSQLDAVGMTVWCELELA